MVSFSLFDLRGIRWVLLGLVVVLGACILDLRCSMARDESVNSGVVAKVRRESVAGRRAWAQQRAEQLEQQLRDARVTARRLVAEGRAGEARPILTAIPELEREIGRLRDK